MTWHNLPDGVLPTLASIAALCPHGWIAVSSGTSPRAPAHALLRGTGNAYDSTSARHRDSPPHR